MEFKDEPLRGRVNKTEKISSWRLLCSESPQSFIEAGCIKMSSPSYLNLNNSMVFLKYGYDPKGSFSFPIKNDKRGNCEDTKYFTGLYPLFCDVIKSKRTTFWSATFHYCSCTLVGCNDMPRVSAKKSCFCFLLASAIIVFFLWPQQSPDPLPPITSPIVQAGEWIEVTEVAEGTPKEEELPREKPWFMSEGTLMPTHMPLGVKSGLWPAQAPPGYDRIVEQLMFRPPKSFQDDDTPKEGSQNLKTILLFNGLNAWYKLKPGRSAFSNCPVDTCKVTASKAESRRVDAILYKDHFVHPGHPKTNKQVWIIYHLECPYHTQHVKYNDVFNWTSTYRRDSDIVAPYEKFVYYDPRVRMLSKPQRNYAANKTKQVAWFVSNCGARNGRLQYAHELQKYISVDIFGACGTKKCPRSNEKKCFEMLNNEYKFYLAFENSNCKDYITEKFFRTGLGHDILPIVMGARPDDYKQSAPEHSYIHVDEFESPRSLAEYLHLLDKDDDAYNAYFKWKGLGEFINTYFFCRLCAMLHDDIPMKSYRDINEWWRGPGICTTGSWRRTGQGWQGMARPNF